MIRTSFALLVVLVLASASAPADAGRLRGSQVLDTDAVFLMPEEPIWFFTLLRDANGRISLMDQSDESPLRTTPLGFAYPTGSTWGSYTGTPDQRVWTAVSMAQGVRVYDLGDVRNAGALAPVLLQAEPAMAGFEPSRTQMGIIAVLIGLAVEPRPSLEVTSVQDGTSNTIMFAWDGNSFEPVIPIGNGVWTWDAAL